MEFPNEIYFQKKKAVKKPQEVQSDTDIDANRCSSLVTNTVQKPTTTHRLSEDKIVGGGGVVAADDEESSCKQDKTVASVGNVENTSVSSVEFVDIVSGEWIIFDFLGDSVEFVCQIRKVTLILNWL